MCACMNTHAHIHTYTRARTLCGASQVSMIDGRGRRRTIKGVTERGANQVGAGAGAGEDVDVRACVQAQ